MCQGRLAEEPERASPTTELPPPTPPQVALLEPLPSEGRQPSLERLAGARLEVRAAGSTLGDLTLALSERLNLPVVVDRSLVGLRLTLRFPEVRLGELLEVLRDGYGVITALDRGVLRFDSEQSVRWRSGLPEGDRPPQREIYEAQLASRLLTPPRDVVPAQLAATLCHHVASPRGRASVVGQQVLVTDIPSALEQAAQLVTALGERTLPEVYRPREW